MMIKKVKHGSRQEAVKELERQLRAWKVRLTADLRGDLGQAEHQSYSELVGEVRDSGDESNAELLVGGEHAELFRHADALNDVDSALERIRDGSFGTCTDCGGEINIKRLRAYPTAKRCIDCQTRHEKRHVANIGPSL
jgi:DnaK suppressor protein